MSEHFPDHIAPINFARNGKSIQQKLAISQLERACSMLISDQGEILVDLHFNTDESNLPVLTGSLKATIQLPCQRCTEAMDIALESTFEMALIQDEKDEESLPEQYEALLVDDKAFSLKDFIEDELILSIPLVANHQPEHCDATQFLQDPTEIEIEEQRENTFQVLEQLKGEV